VPIQSGWIVSLTNPLGLENKNCNDDIIIMNYISYGIGFSSDLVKSFEVSYSNLVNIWRKSVI